MWQESRLPCSLWLLWHPRGFRLANQPTYTQDSRLPGKGDGDSALSCLPESVLRLYPYAGCCKRYKASATDFSCERERYFSFQRDDTLREDFLRNSTALARAMSKSGLPLTCRSTRINGRDDPYTIDYTDATAISGSCH